MNTDHCVVDGRKRLELTFQDVDVPFSEKMYVIGKRKVVKRSDVPLFTRQVYERKNLLDS